MLFMLYVPLLALASDFDSMENARLIFLGVDDALLVYNTNLFSRSPWLCILHSLLKLSTSDL